MRPACLLILLATGCGSGLPDTPSDLDEREADCRAAASAFELPKGTLVTDMVAYAGSLWTLHADYVIGEAEYHEVGRDLTLTQRSCDGNAVNEWLLEREGYTIQNAHLVPMGGTLAVVGTEVLGGDYPVGEIAALIYDLDEGELLAESLLDLPAPARLGGLLDARASGDSLTIQVRVPTADKEWVELVRFPTVVDPEPGTSLGTYDVPAGRDAELGQLALTEDGPAAFWQTQWPHWDQFVVRNDGELDEVDPNVSVRMAATGDRGWMTYGPSLEDLNTGATMELPPNTNGLVAQSTGPALIVRATAERPDRVMRYDLDLNLLQTVPLEFSPYGVIDLGDGQALVRRSLYDEERAYSDSFTLLSDGGES